MAKHSNESGRHPVQQGGSYDTSGSIETNVADGFTMVAVGDLIVTRPLTKYQGASFAAAVKVWRCVSPEPAGARP